MALTQVGIPRPAPKVTEGDSGGGLFGSILGAVVGAAATIFTAGAAAPLAASAVLGGAAAGQGIGGIVGGALAPGQKGSVEEQAAVGVQGGGDAMSRKFSQESAQNVAQSTAPQGGDPLMDAMGAARQAPQEVQALAVPHLVDAILKRAGSGGQAVA